MSTDPLDQIEYHLSQAMHLLHQYRNGSAPLPKELAGHLARKPAGMNNKSLREWVAWLKRNQTAYRQDIWDATGLNLTAHKSSILDWTSDMAYWDDSQMPPDSLCRMRGPAFGPGAPPSIYFLWSQRFDVHSLFGVGPDGRPEPVEESEPETLLGVVHPPVTADFKPLEQQEIRNPQDEVESRSTEEEEASQRFATMDEWHARWDPLFADLAKYSMPPTDEEKQEMLDTMPEDTGGETPGTVLARSLYEAKQDLSG
jgi:hypothetical protein